MSVFQLVRRLDLLTMMGTCAALTSLAGAETAPTYHATELGILGGRAEVGTFALDLNNQGHVVGYSSTPGTVHASRKAVPGK